MKLVLEFTDDLAAGLDAVSRQMGQSPDEMVLNGLGSYLMQIMRADRFYPVKELPEFFEDPAQSLQYAMRFFWKWQKARRCTPGYQFVVETENGLRKVDPTPINILGKNKLTGKDAEPMVVVEIVGPQPD